MATLNLHLDFMEDHKPIHFTMLSSEEELQIMRDSTKLLEEINEDFRILDKMCSALDNLIIIKEHYEQYGTSPALEALVGDIRQYLGISMEAEEGEESGDSEKKEGGGIGGVIAKIWNWFCRLLSRIGNWLGLCEKVAESSRLDDDVRFNNSSNYEIDVCKLIFSDGKVVKRIDEIKKIKNQIFNFADSVIKPDAYKPSQQELDEEKKRSDASKSAREMKTGSRKVEETKPLRPDDYDKRVKKVTNSLMSYNSFFSTEAEDTTISVSNSGNSSISVAGSTNSTAMVNSMKNLKELATPVKQNVPGNLIVDLNHAAYDFYKETKSIVSDLEKKFKAVSSKMASFKTTLKVRDRNNPSKHKKITTNIATPDQSKAFGIIRESLDCVNKSIHNVVSVASKTKKIVYPNLDKKKEENKPEQQQNQQQSSNTGNQQEQKPAEGEKKPEANKPEENKQPEQKQEEKK